MNKVKSKKAKPGAYYALPDLELGSPECRQTMRTLRKRKFLQRLLIATHLYLIIYPFHKGKTDHKVYLVKVKINPNFFLLTLYCPVLVILHGYYTQI